MLAAGITIALILPIFQIIRVWCWPDAYYMTSNESDGPAVYAFDRAKMLDGKPATLQRFMADQPSGFGFQALTPADLDGATAPPPGSPFYVMRHRDDEVHNVNSNNAGQDFLELYELRIDWAIPLIPQ